MKNRYQDNNKYFNEVANTSRDYYVDYLGRFVGIGAGTRVFEVGCGLGGNLLPFLERGCSVTGVDNSKPKIDSAIEIFPTTSGKPEFIACDFFEMAVPQDDQKYDIVIVHDVIEHIHDKTTFVGHVKKFVKPEGIVFWAFPAWQMPFGGHQQLCQSRICRATPFLHLLPAKVYKGLLKAFGESDGLVNALVDIKECRTSIGHFEKIIHQNGMTIVDRNLWFINPHYKQKFNLRPRELNRIIAKTPYFRNFFSTSCFYITK